MNTASLPHTISRVAGDTLTVILRREPEGPIIWREPVTRADLADAFGEAWRDGCLRRGRPDIALAEAPIELAPKVSAGSSGRCRGFVLEVSVPGQPRTRHEFSIRSLSSVARRAADPLAAAGLLRDRHSYCYELLHEPSVTPGHKSLMTDLSLPVQVRTAPLSYLQAPLHPLLEQARVAVPHDEDLPPVFFTQEAYALAEQCARRGAAMNPPVETGGVLIGALGACPDSGELSVIVTDVLEVQDAEQREFSLSYTGATWARIQNLIRARQTAQPDRAQRLLGQCHGYNFLPHNDAVCAACRHRPTCDLTSAIMSREDQTWTRAVFVRQPWALCHIFGLTARGEPANRLYGIKDGQLQPRGFYLLPQFTSDLWEPGNPAPKTSKLA